jgi:hypothetical protein
MTTKEKIKHRTYLNARQVIKQTFADDKGLRIAYQANIACLLMDRYGFDDYNTRMEAADNIIKLVFEDTYY